MKKLFFLALILSACKTDVQTNQKTFPVLTSFDEEDIAYYEGRWDTNGGVIRFELSLKAGSFGYDSYYKLNEAFESDSVASGTVSEGSYTTYSLSDNTLGICLHHVETYDKGTYLRYQKESNPDKEEEVFFISRGNEELIPCDNKFNPLTSDRRYTLHKRSKLFTVEGYFTLEEDSIQFFERNTREYWKVTDLGEFNQLRPAYDELAKEKHEGIYLKALAYSLTEVPNHKNELVVKRIIRLGNDPD